MTDPHVMQSLLGRIVAVYTDSDGDEYLIRNCERVYIRVTDERGNVHAGLPHWVEESSHAPR